jgi:hypothetical protein
MVNGVYKYKRIIYTLSSFNLNKDGNVSIT